jgi:outer membrane protein assembly factor BamA
MIAGAYADANWDFSGSLGRWSDLKLTLPLNQTGYVTTGEFLFRLAPRIYLGPTFQFLNVRTHLREKDLPDSGLGGRLGELFNSILDQLAANTVSLGFHFQWDSRDNTFFPRAGSLLDASGDFYRDTWGSDFDYEIYKVVFNHYIGFKEKNVIAVEGCGRFAYGDAPFFALSNMNLRGYSFGTYMDNLMLTGQVEYRRDLWWRLGMAAFAGMGEVSPEWSSFNWENVVPSYGAGIRFRLSRNNPVNLRVDFAFTDDDFAVLLTLGEAF